MTVSEIQTTNGSRYWLKILLGGFPVTVYHKLGISDWTCRIGDTGDWLRPFHACFIGLWKAFLWFIRLPYFATCLCREKNSLFFKRKKKSLEVLWSWRRKCQLPHLFSLICVFTLQGRPFFFWCCFSKRKFRTVAGLSLLRDGVWEECPVGNRRFFCTFLEIENE